MTLAPDYRIDTLNDHVGRDFGLTGGMLVDQALIDRFAECSRDEQWVHVDVERARSSPLGTTIAHGLLTLSLTTAAQYELGVFPSDAGQVLNYGLDKVRFLAPVKAGARLRTHIKLAEVKEQGGGRKLVKLINTIEIEGEVKPALIAETLIVLVGPA